MAKTAASSLTSDAITDTILLSIAEGVTIYDTDFRLVAWNERYAEMGITPREHLQPGLHIEETYRYASELGVFGNGVPEKIAKDRIDQIYSGNSPSIEDLEGIDGSIIEIRRYFLNGIGVAAVFSDVTEARRMSAKARRAEDLEVLARVSGGVAHDFNNLIQAVSANLELAQISGKPEYLQNAIDAISSGADLAKCMLQLARPNKSQTHESKFDVVASTNSTVNWIRRVLNDNVSISLDQRVETGIILATEGRFSLSLVNLIMNSNDAMDRGGCIFVTIETIPNRPDVIQISIQDDGHGMSEELAIKANEPFFTTKGEKGTGLGIYEVKSFVDSVGGEFSLTSTLGTGTTASISLPVELESIRAEVAPAKKLKKLQARVLLIEDDLDVQKSLQHLLNSIGCQTISATTGEDAIDVLDAIDVQFFDIVISDFALGGSVNGRDIVIHVVNTKPKLPVLLCTANPTWELNDLPTKVTIVQKPLDVCELHCQISKAISLRQDQGAK